jgi:hypothetical protein
MRSTKLTIYLDEAPGGDASISLRLDGDEMTDDTVSAALRAAADLVDVHGIEKATDAASVSPPQPDQEGAASAKHANVGREQTWTGAVAPATSGPLPWCVASGLSAPVRPVDGHGHDVGTGGHDDE